MAPRTWRPRLNFESLELRQMCAVDGFLLSSTTAPSTESTAAIFATSVAPQHNSVSPKDVNADDVVTSLDALLVINVLNRLAAESELSVNDSTGSLYPDVNNDQRISPFDALLVINDLNARLAAAAILLQPLPTPCTAADRMSPLITECEVRQFLARAGAASASEDAVIAVVDRGGRILGVRAEQGVLDTIPDDLTLVFAIDGAVAKARTAAFFSNADPRIQTAAPLTSRTIRFISQSTITQREVESNPTVPNPLVDDPFDPADPISRTFGPGFVAPIGLGGHFPPGVAYTPPVDLFGIEHQSRDSLIHPGVDGIKGTLDDENLTGRFNIDPMFVPLGNELNAPESYGVQSGRVLHAQSRGIATLPGGIPLFKKNEQLGGKLEVVGGIGVFFPGPKGYASYEQGFIPAVGQNSEQRLNAARVLEAEWIAFAAAGGNAAALGGINPVEGYVLPIGRIDLVGITLEIYGPHPTTTNPRTGIETLLVVGMQVGQGSPISGLDQSVNLGPDMDPLTTLDNATALPGERVGEGWLVEPHGSGTLTKADVEAIILQAVAEAEKVRAAIRLDVSQFPFRPGPRTRMVLSVADKDGNVLGVYRMDDATIFSIDVSIAKARNTAYYADAAAIVPDDLVDDDLLVARGAVSAGLLASQGIRTDGTVGTPDLYADVNSSTRASPQTGVAFTNRTFRFLAEARYPAGIDGSLPPIFSILNDPSINPLTAENIGPPAPAARFRSVVGFDAFHLGRNFHDPDSIANQNGVVFFPGSTPIYKDGVLVGGFGVSGDGVDQDDVVTAAGAQGYAPPTSLRVDNYYYRGVRLPFQKFNRNPHG